MSARRTLKCAKCGVENPIGRIFCTSCGARLDLAAAESLHGRRATHFPIGRYMVQFAGWALRLVLVGLVIAVVLMLLPSPGGGTYETSREKVGSFRRKLGALEQGLAQRESSAVWFESAEINSYLAALIAARGFERPWRPYWKGELEAAVVRLSPEGFQARLRVGWGPLRVEYRIKGRAVIGDSGVEFRDLRLWVGRLRLPGGIARPTLRRLAAGFQELERINRILENLILLRWDEGRVLCGV